MGKIKAGSNQSNRQLISQKDLSRISIPELVDEPIKITAQNNSECPVVNDYWVRKHSTGLRKELEQLKVDLRHRGVALDEKLMVQESKLLNEIDGCFQATAMLVDKVNQEINELKLQINQQQKPVELQVVKVEEPKIETQIHTIEIKQVMPTYAKYIIAGLAIANVLILLLK